MERQRTVIIILLPLFQCSWGHIVVIVWTSDVDGGKIVVTFWVLLFVVGSGEVKSSLDGVVVGRSGILVVWFGTMTEPRRSLGFDGEHIVANVWESGVDGGIILMIVRALPVVIGKII